MKKILFYFLFLNLSVFSNSYPEITNSNINSLTNNYTFVYNVTSCGIAYRYIEIYLRSLKDITGLKGAWIQQNTASQLLNNSNRFLLVKDGKVIDSFSEFSEGVRPIGNNEIRIWIYRTIKKHKLPIQMENPPELFVTPSTNNGSEDLKKGLFAHFPLKNDFKDISTEKSALFSKNVSIKSSFKNNSLFVNGEYSNEDDLAFDVNSNRYGHIYQKGYGFSINFKPEKKNKNHHQWLFTIGYRVFQFYLNSTNNKLIFDFSVYCKKCESNGKDYEYSEIFEYPDIKLEFGKWYHLVSSFDPEKKTVTIVLNGKRLKDIKLGEEIVKFFLDKNSLTYITTAFEFGNSGYGAVSTGYFKDLLLFDRALYTNEMYSLFKTYGSDTSPLPTPNEEIADKKNQEKLDNEFLKAAKSGNLSEVKKLYKEGANKNAIYKKWSALMFASYYGFEDIVKFLVENKVDVLYEFQAGWNAEKIAEVRNFPNIVKLLEDASNKVEFFALRRFKNTKLERSKFEPPK